VQPQSEARDPFEQRVEVLGVDDRLDDLCLAAMGAITIITSKAEADRGPDLPLMTRR
jgi:hypothetical protein